MPLVEVERVLPDEALGAAPPGLARALAGAAGAVFASAPGQTWVRLRELPRSAYAENGDALDDNRLPVFVTVTHAHPLQGAELATQVRALTDALAAALACDSQHVHVQIAPPGAGRQAFGGRLVP
jgi:phenylpyruvate tautomerase PptA (4-oxalocrotonate tautomerase family)